jgi:hypothetical protein
VACPGQIILMRGNHHHRSRLDVEYLGHPKVGFRGWLVFLERLFLRFSLLRK